MKSVCCAALAQLPALLTCSTPTSHAHRGRPLQVRGCREQGRGAAVGALRVRPGGAAGCGTRRLFGRAGVRQLHLFAPSCLTMKSFMTASFIKSHPCPLYTTHSAHAVYQAFHRVSVERSSSCGYLCPCTQGSDMCVRFLVRRLCTSIFMHADTPSAARPLTSSGT